LINFVDATNDANHYTKPPHKVVSGIYHGTTSPGTLQWGKFGENRWKMTIWERSTRLC